MRSMCMLLMLALELASSGVAQITRFEGQPILEIQYLPPDVLAPADLEKVQTLRKGARLSPSEVATAIDRLFATGAFSDIIVEAEPAPAGSGVTVRFVTQPQYFVGGVNVEGRLNTPPNTGELVSSAQLTPGTPFREEDVTRAVGSLTRLLQSNGFYEGQVASHVERDERGHQVFVTFDVKEQKRAKYATPQIQGNTLLSDSTIVHATGWRVPVIHWWRQVTNSRTRRGLQGVLKKYQGQDRLKARVGLQSMAYDPDTNRVTPHLTVDPGPKIEVTAIETKVSRRTLKKYVPVFQAQAVDNDLLVAGQRNLESYFQSKGYYDASVEFRLATSKPGTETIEYVIARGQQFKVVKVSVTGNKYFDTETIRERMFIQPAALNIRHGRYSEVFRRQDEDNIVALYKSNGFRDATVSIVVTRNYEGKAGDVEVTVRIHEGTQWLVEHLEISGADKIGNDKLLPLVASIAGQPFAEVNLASDRNAVLTYYFEQGFPDASFHAGFENASQPHRVNVTYTLAEGDRKFVRDVLISGLRETRPGLVQQAITLKPGDPLSLVEQTTIQQQLYNLGIFARADTAIQNAAGNTDHKYVLYHFEEASRYALKIGFGAQIARFGQPSVQSLGSPGGTTGFSPQVSAQLSRMNFLGLGHTVTVRGAYSSVERLAYVSYLQPRFTNLEGRNLTYTLFVDNQRDVRTFSSRRTEGSVQMSQVFSKSLTGIFGFAYRRVSVSNVVIPVLLIPQLLQPVQIGFLSVNLAQDRRDNSADPHRGIYNTIDAGLASNYFGSQRSFTRVLLRNATYYSLSRKVVFARQTQFGVIQPFNAPPGLTAVQSVPLPERFFGGGADSLRAFPYNQAGPRDTGAPLVPNGPSSVPTGFPLGGNAVLFNNLELRFPLYGENIRGVLFHDMGNVYTSLGTVSFRVTQRSLQDFDYMVHAVGFGIRYKTPVGPIRLDLAYSINPPSYVGFGGTPQQILQCNPNGTSTLPFCQPSPQSISHFQFFFSIGQTF